VPPCGCGPARSETIAPVARCTTSSAPGAIPPPHARPS
jgi:hypothetical protein